MNRGGIGFAGNIPREHGAETEVESKPDPEVPAALGGPEKQAATREEVFNALDEFAGKVGGDIAKIVDRQKQFEAHVNGLASSQAMFEWQAERNARATAMKLAIDFLALGPENEPRPHPDVLINVAEAILPWLKESQQ